MLLTLIKNEFIKMFSRAKTWIVLGLFVAFVGLNIFGTWYSEKNMLEWNSPEYQLQNAEQNLVHAQESLKRAEEDGDARWIESEKEYIASVQETIDYNKKIIEDGVDSDAWKKQLDERIKHQNEYIKSMETEGINEYNNMWYSQAKQELSDLEYLKTNNIQPLEGWEYQAYNMFFTLNMFFGLGILIAGIAVFMSDMVSGECTPATLKFLLVQPIKRGKVLLSKYIVSVITVVFMIMIPQILGMVFVNVHSGINPSDYPVRVEQKYEKVFDKESGEMTLQAVADTSKMVTNKEAAVMTMGYQVLFVIAACSVIFMMSAIFKSSMIAMAVSVISTVFLTIATPMIGPLKDISQYLFTSYADAGSLVTSKLPFVFGNPQLTTTNAVICLLATTIVAYAIGHICFVKKDILI